MFPKMTTIDAAGLLDISLQAIHKALKSKKLKFEKAQNRVFFGHETARELFHFNFKSQIVAFQIVKGGTGKTSLAQAVAIRASLYGARVLCIDLDQQGNLTESFQVHAEQYPCMIDVINQKVSLEEAIVPVYPGLDLICSKIDNALIDNTIMLNRLPIDRIYRDAFANLKAKYDLIVIDCPPALGQSVAAAALASDLIIAPVAPEKFCLSGLKVTTQEISNLENIYKTKVPIRIILNKYDNRTTLSHDIMTSLVKHPIFGEIVFKGYIRSTQEFPNAIARKQSIFDSFRDTTAKEDIDVFTKDLLGVQRSEVIENIVGSLDQIAVNS